MSVPSIGPHASTHGSSRCSVAGSSNSDFAGFGARAANQASQVTSSSESTNAGQNGNQKRQHGSKWDIRCFTLFCTFLHLFHGLAKDSIILGMLVHSLALSIGRWSTHLLKHPGTIATALVLLPLVTTLVVAIARFAKSQGPKGAKGLILKLHRADTAGTGHRQRRKKCQKHPH